MSRGLAIGACLVVLSCGLGTPTPPEPEPERDASPVQGTPLPPAVPGAAGTPTPSPSPGEPSPTPTPSPTPDTKGCGAPLPPPVSKIGLNIHARGSDAWTLDSTPLVGPDAVYCKEIGFTDGRSVCPVRPEGNPERSACELYVMGRAKDTNRAGPTWYFNGGFCTGEVSGCQNHPENQYLLRIFVSGTFKACSRTDVCGEIVADP